VKRLLFLVSGVAALLRTPFIAVVAFLTVFSIVGCASSNSSAAQPVASPHPVSGSSASYRRPKPWYRKGMRTVGFQSPTGNIRCAVESDDHTQLLCKTINNGDAIDLDAYFQADTYITASIPLEPVLAYGKVWSSANFYCWSRFTGVTCRSLHSKNGFEIDRAKRQLLVWDHSVLGGLGSLGGGSSGSLGGSSSGGGGSGGSFCTTHTCIGNFNQGNGYVVQCADGTWSHSGGESGACSWHGGEG
jgi:uncharacterized membrane protein YgcG